jgi:hypothetical protein
MNAFSQSLLEVVLPEDKEVLFSKEAEVGDFKRFHVSGHDC